MTDDGVNAAATETTRTMTGVESSSDPQSYQYPYLSGYSNWKEVTQGGNSIGCKGQSDRIPNENLVAGSTMQFNITKGILFKACESPFPD